MRQIEREMNYALRAGYDFSKSNTMVRHEDGRGYVYLHGNHIATLSDDGLTLYDGGWQSNTTKSRLNALINEFCDGTKFGVFQKNWEWFVSTATGTIDFYSGVTLS